MSTTNSNTLQLTIGEIVANDFRKAEIFKKAGIDFCCGGKMSMDEACQQKGIDKTILEEELLMVEKSPISPSMDYNNWQLDFLCDFIVNSHHQYVKKTMPQLVAYTQKIADVHGSHHPELIKVADLFAQISSELNQHLQHEEEVLFPAIKQLVRANDESSKPTIISEINRMWGEHDFAGGAMDNINEITNQYALPEDACNTYLVTFKLLNEFEDDLHNHVHLENNILFPKALKLANG
jgi:regulator of cell morphogenesis and NO signaling